MMFTQYPLYRCQLVGRFMKQITWTHIHRHVHQLCKVSVGPMTVRHFTSFGHFDNHQMLIESKQKTFFCNSIHKNICTGCRYPMMNKADTTGEEELTQLREKYKDDPQVKQWLAELTTDFGNEKGSHDNNEPKTNVDENVVEKTDKETVNVDKELLRYNIEEFYDTHTTEEEMETPQEILHPISLERGTKGVFDIEEIVQVLHSENGSDLCVISVPDEYDYVDYLVIVTGRSLRHLKAMAFYIKWLYKQKRRGNDAPSCKIEGLNSNDWLAIDLKNVVIHFMLPGTREQYDLETLWTVGAQFDDKTVEDEVDPFTMLLNEDHATQTVINKNSKREDVLTLSEKAKYIYDDEEESSRVQLKFSRKANKTENMDMENIAGWHSYKDVDGSASK